MSTKAEALVVPDGASTFFQVLDRVPAETFIDIHGGPEERIRAAASAAPEAAESDRREAASAVGAAGRLDSREATFPLSSSNPLKPTDSAESGGAKPSHLLATTKGRYDLRHGVASMLRPDDGGRGPSVCGCGISGHNVEAVRLHQNDRGKARVSGVFRCNSAVHCPVCSVKRAMEIQEGLTEAVQACIEKGGSVWFLTPTVRRKLDQDLAKLRAGFQAAYREARQGRAWVEPSEAAGFLGIANVVEAPWSPATGWGLHGHSLMFFASPFAEPKEVRLRALYARAERIAAGQARPVVGDCRLSCLPDGEAVPEAAFWVLYDQNWTEEHEFTDAAQRPLCDLLMSRFLDRLPKHGLSGTIDAQGVEMVRSGKGAARYLGKIASEVAHGWVKEGRKAASTSVHPFALAARGSIRGKDGLPMEIPGLEKVAQANARALWQEYAAAMKGIRLGIITAKLAEKLGIQPMPEEQEDGEQEFLEEGHIGDVPAKMWNHLIRRALAGTFLARIENEIDPAEADDYRRDQFGEIRNDFLDSWLETGSDEAKLFARLWRRSGEDVDTNAEDDDDSDESFMSNDHLPPSQRGRAIVERARLTRDMKRLRKEESKLGERFSILARLRNARVEAITRFRRKEADYRMMLRNAVTRVHANDGHGTLDRVRWIIDALHAAVPQIRPLDEIEVMRACADERARFEAAQASRPQSTGIIVNDIGDTF
ncbi:hypothetical protein LB543_01250 [Mesorhizobium sp. ESP7-2]|uniref:hypothetical protein n=1 Tax=Mesorhizobium sp. ESP7-2 TaxID=2876622 RepID=UPI001CCECE72|nr:hypothetical protein [Mesorhizobium sp. ESP7-2]MBZ9705355.1 hypothetical protein [Mesorhizobium sp. ESP7-2]